MVGVSPGLQGAYRGRMDTYLRSQGDRKGR